MERRELSNWLCSFKNVVRDKPWMAMRDFNATLKLCESPGDRIVVIIGMIDF